MLRAFGRKRVAPKERGDNMAPAAKKFVLRPSMDGDEGVWSRYIDGSIANTSFSSEVVSRTPISTTATFTEPITQSGIFQFFKPYLRAVKQVITGQEISL